MEDAANDSSHKRYRVSLIDFVVEILLGIVSRLRWEDVEKRSQAVKTLARDVADFEDRAEALTQEILLVIVLYKLSGRGLNIF